MTWRRPSVAAAWISGIAVHIGARIGALASPSEVLVSSTVKDLVVGSGQQVMRPIGGRSVRA